MSDDLAAIDEMVAFLAARYAEDWGAARDRELESGLHESRATRDVDAKREIVRHIRVAVPFLAAADPAYGDALVFILRRFAAVYSDHPDYRAKWKI